MMRMPSLIGKMVLILATGQLWNDLEGPPTRTRLKSNESLILSSQLFDVSPKMEVWRCWLDLANLRASSNDLIS